MISTLKGKFLHYTYIFAGRGCFLVMGWDLKGTNMIYM
jgi:hypothetical protein